MNSTPPSARNQPIKLNSFRQIGALCLILIPIGLVGWVVLSYALNLPYWDDYLVQDHLLLLKHSSGSQKLAHLFDQHWEHRIVWTRLIFAAFTKLNGSLNYYGLTLIGVSGLLGVLGLLFAVFKRVNLPLLYFVPIPFWLFTLQSHENLIWAMASVQNFWILVFALGSFYALANYNTRTRWLALSLAVLATFTSGNGALVLIAGLLVLAYLRQWRFAVLWGFTTLLALGGYFFHYQRISFFPSPFKYPFIDWVKAFFVFLGAFGDPYPYSGSGAIGYENPLGIIILLGAVVVGLALYFLQTQFWPGLTRQPSLGVNQIFFLGCILFLFATAAITVYSRVGFAGPAYLLQGRYKIYAALTLSVVYLMGLSVWRQHPYRPAIALLVGLLTIGQSLFSDYLCLEGIINQNRRTVAEYFNYLVNTPLERQQAIRQVFVPTELPFYNQQVASLADTVWLKTPTSTAFDRVENRPFMFNIAKKGVVNPTLAQPSEGAYIYVKSPARTYLFAARPRRPSPTALSDFDAYFTKDQLLAQVLKEKLEPGRYRLGLLTYQQHKIRLAMTSQYVTFTSF